MINLQTPINTLGYGVAGLNILKALKKKTDVALHMIGQPEVTKNEDVSIVNEAIQSSKFFDRDAVCIKIWHQNQMAERIGSGKFIGFPIFELDKFDELERHHLSSCDEWMVCSQWAKDVIQSSVGFKDTHIIPLGVDTKIFSPDNSVQNQKTIFFNCGKWEKRKGHDVIIECFNKAFDGDDNVELWMMCDNPFIKNGTEWQQLYKRSNLGHKIMIIPRQRHHSDVAKIMNMSDCGIFPARAEGWNLELLEMMACGKHVIATNYSAHTEFCNPVNSRLINIDKLEVAEDGVFFDGKKGNWAELGSNQIDQIIENMRDIHKLKQENKLTINSSGVATAQEFSWENSANKILEIL